MFKHYLLRSIGTHRKAPRLYLDDAFLLNTAFQPGCSFTVCSEHEGERIVIKVEPKGSRTVSSKKKSGRIQPVIDINNRCDLAAFASFTAVRIVVTHDTLYVMIPASERNRRERLQRLVDKVTAGVPLRTTSLAHGIGVMSHAVHAGLKAAGVNAQLDLANEIDTQMISQAIQHNDAWHPQTRSLSAPMQEVVQDPWLMKQLGTTEVLDLGIPCSGASRAGKAKRGIAHMEQHPEVGHLVSPAIMLTQQLQPVVFALENVVLYKGSASADILRYMLRDMGYEVHEVELDGRNFGSPEARVRWFMIAVTVGIELDLSVLQQRKVDLQPLSEYLDHFPEDHVRWKTYDYLKAKQVRDAQKGSCFAMQTVRPDDCTIPTLRKGVAKTGSTDPLIAHPSEPNLLRCLTAAEHCKIKGSPLNLIEGMSEVKAHEGLGQSVSYAVVEELFNVVGQSLLHFVAKAKEKMTPSRAQAYNLKTVTG